jgi:hypothetical protein
MVSCLVSLLLNEKEVRAKRARGLVVPPRKGGSYERIQPF